MRYQNHSPQSSSCEFTHVEVWTKNKAAESVKDSEIRQFIDKCLRHKSDRPKENDLLMDSFLADDDVSEISTTVGISAATVKTLRETVRDQMARLHGEKYDDTTSRSQVGNTSDSRIVELRVIRASAFLRENKDCFAWSHKDMTGIDPSIISHKLNIDPNHKPVKAKTFQLGDWVLSKAFQNTKNPADEKLVPPWEGPYEITQVIGIGAYRLTDQQGNPVPRSWNGTHLRKYYF
uniref:Uncharacterized protein n=1 Tax=Chenopodium quinoa TaxID=63459 RepID=A0A803MT82_CHEQI